MPERRRFDPLHLGTDEHPYSKGLMARALMRTGLGVAGAYEVARRVEQALNLGWIGVTLFFALSGYLITRSLLLSSDSPSYFRDFFARRILRIFPLYYATLFLLLVVLPALGIAIGWLVTHRRARAKP